MSVQRETGSESVLIQLHFNPYLMHQQLHSRLTPRECLYAPAGIIAFPVMRTLMQVNYKVKDILLMGTQELPSDFF